MSANSAARPHRTVRRSYRVEELDCANCAAKMESAVSRIDGVAYARVDFMAQRLTLEADEGRFEAILKEAERACRHVEPDVRIVREGRHADSKLTDDQRRTLVRIAVAFLAYACIGIAVWALPLEAMLGGEAQALYLEFALYLVPYLIAGYDVLLKAARNIARGRVFDENFLMSIATVGAFALVFFPESDPHMAEGAAVMLFYQVGELFQDYAVERSRRSIAEMMDIAPEYANVLKDGRLVRTDPSDVRPGETFVAKPGERIALDGRVLKGASQLDTAALTGESRPREVEPGSEVISGCVNLTGTLTIECTKPYEDSTVARILELVENASERKARSESFIARFARYYTPAVVVIALLLSVLPPVLLGQAWSDWVQRGLIFLVVSCPCALVISVPLSFFGGIGGASRSGILVKGSNYLEALASAECAVFDKTGTLTTGTFEVVEVRPVQVGLGIDTDRARARLLEVASLAEACSDHPIAASVRRAWGHDADLARVTEAREIAGKGVIALVDGARVHVGNAELMAQAGIEVTDGSAHGTVLHVARDGSYLGLIAVADAVKPRAKEALASLKRAGVARTVMLTGDREQTAEAVARELGIDEYRARLLPQDKVAIVEELLSEDGREGALAFVGDGINDAPVLMRADVGIAMGAMGSDAAIEAADVVLMDDDPSKIALAIAFARKTVRIVRQNIVFALGVKALVLALAALGIANMWLAVFADVGVAVLAILNAMRCMRAETPR